MSWLRTLFTVKKTLLITVGSIVVVAGLTAGGVFAYFSNQVSSAPNTFAAGTIQLAPGDNFSVSWNVEDIKPGWGIGQNYEQGLSEEIVIENVGTNPFNYSVMYDKSDLLWTCDPDIANSSTCGWCELMISMDIIDDPGTEHDISFHTDDKGDGVPHPGRDYGQGVGTNDNGVENYIEPDETETVQFWARLPGCASNGCMSLKGTVTITFIAFQHEYLDVSIEPTPGPDPEWRDNVDFSVSTFPPGGGVPTPSPLRNYVHLENKDSDWRTIDADGIEGHVKYLDDASLMVDGNSYLTGIVQAYGLDPERQYQLKLASKNLSTGGTGEALGNACATPSVAVPGYEPAYECNGALGIPAEYFWVIDLDAAPNEFGEINQAFQVRGSLLDGTYGDYDHRDSATNEPVAILFRVNEATNNGWYKAVLMEDNEHNTAPDAMEFTLR
jgi:predicted ribosomally synthesized peptide with SipW-like signal peptide